jgi:hypothetical protein
MNRDIGKHFDVKYSVTSESRRDIKVRYHISSGAGASPLVLSDLRTYLYSYLFAKTADRHSEGTLHITTSDPSCPVALNTLNLLSNRLSLPPTSDFTGIKRDNKGLYMKYAEALAENKDAFFCFCGSEDGGCQC